MICRAVLSILVFGTLLSVSAVFVPTGLLHSMRSHLDAIDATEGPADFVGEQVSHDGRLQQVVSPRHLSPYLG